MLNNPEKNPAFKYWWAYTMASVEEKNHQAFIFIQIVEQAVLSGMY